MPSCCPATRDVYKRQAVPRDPQAFYCGIPDMYRETGVPLADIHHIQWSDLDGKTQMCIRDSIERFLRTGFQISQ